MWFIVITNTVQNFRSSSSRTSTSTLFSIDCVEIYCIRGACQNFYLFIICVYINVSCHFVYKTTLSFTLYSYMYIFKFELHCCLPIYVSYFSTTTTRPTCSFSRMPAFDKYELVRQEVNTTSTYNLGLDTSIRTSYSR